MGVSVRGHSDLHLHSPCPECGYATRYKHWPITCACSNAQRQKIRTTPAAHVVEIWAEQERKNAELHQVDHSHIPPLRICSVTGLPTAAPLTAESAPAKPAAKK